MAINVKLDFEVFVSPRKIKYSSITQFLNHSRRCAMGGYNPFPFPSPLLGLHATSRRRAALLGLSSGGPLSGFQCAEGMCENFRAAKGARRVAGSIFLFLPHSVATFYKTGAHSPARSGTESASTIPQSLRKVRTSASGIPTLTVLWRALVRIKECRRDVGKFPCC